jgi:hypothetical protein
VCVDDRFTIAASTFPEHPPERIPSSGKPALFQIQNKIQKAVTQAELPHMLPGSLRPVGQLWPATQVS